MIFCKILFKMNLRSTLRFASYYHYFLPCSQVNLCCTSIKSRPCSSYLPVSPWFSSRKPNLLLSVRSTTEVKCSFYRKSNKDEVQDAPKTSLSLYQRFKLMYKEYWYVLLPVHVATSAVWLGGFYYLAISGIDIATLLEVSGAPESWVLTIRDSKAGGIVTAYTMYKVATPARYTVTLGGTTLSINYLKKWGWIKPIPNKEKLIEIYDQQKSVFKDKMITTKDEIKDEFKKTATEITQHMKEAKTGFQQSVNDTSQGFKEGVRDAADEWRHVGKLIKRNVKEIIKPQKEEK